MGKIAQSAAVQPSADCSKRLERLYKHWRKLVQLQNKTPEQESLAPSSANGSALIDPWVLVDSAKCTPATNLRELLFKLAFWRWKNPSIGTDLNAMQDTDALVYSVYLDLLRLTNEKSVMSAIDHCALERDLELRSNSM